jgi:hypothetical protein
VKLLLKVASAAIFLFMVTVTIRTSLTESLFAAWPAYRASPWAMATFWDAYCGFTLFWFWVASREKNWAARIFWLVLIFGFGNIATSAYLFIALSRLRDDQPASDVL